jgi:anti-sigma factor RsiW
MTCREIVEFLMAYLSGELPAEQRTIFEEHLAECPACVNYLDNYRQTIQLSKMALCEPPERLPQELPDDLVQAILAARQLPG